MIATLQDTDELLRSSEHHRPAGVRQEGNGLLPSLVSLCHRRHEHPAGDWRFCQSYLLLYFWSSRKTKCLPILGSNLGSNNVQKHFSIQWYDITKKPSGKVFLRIERWSMPPQIFSIILKGDQCLLKYSQRWSMPPQTFWSTGSWAAPSESTSTRSSRSRR